MLMMFISMVDVFEAHRDKMLALAPTPFISYLLFSYIKYSFVPPIIPMALEVITERLIEWRNRILY
jgi:hypothetical protein